MLYPPPRGATHRLAPARVLEQLAERLGERWNAAGGNEQPALAVLQGLADAAHIARHDRRAGRHRLEDRVGEGLGERWMHEDVRAPQRRQRVRAATQEVHR